MKNLFVTILLTACAVSANAGTYSCKNVSGTQFLIKTDMAAAKAAIYGKTATEKKWTPVYEEANLVIAADGGPMNIFGQDKTPIDWKKVKGCYVWRKPSLRISINAKSTGVTGKLQYVPNISIRPNTMCNIPRVRPAPVQELVCESH